MLTLRRTPSLVPVRGVPHRDGWVIALTRQRLAFGSRRIYCHPKKDSFSLFHQRAGQHCCYFPWMNNTVVWSTDQTISPAATALGRCVFFLSENCHRVGSLWGQRRIIKGESPTEAHENKMYQREPCPNLHHLRDKSPSVGVKNILIPRAEHSARRVQQIRTERMSDTRKNPAPVKTSASSADPLVPETFQVHLSIRRLGFVVLVQLWFLSPS